MRELPSNLIDQIVERLVDALRPLEIYLFGSHAHGTPHKHSDLDFLVVVPDNAGDRWELANQGRSSLWGLRVPVDVFVFHRSAMDKWAPVRFSLPHEATQKGKLVYAAGTRVGQAVVGTRNG